MKLQVLSKDDCEKVRIWRNEVLDTLRTPFPLTKEMQEDFYKNVVCNRNSPHRYYALYNNNLLIGMGGLTNIEWENGQAEISLIINKADQQCGLGSEAVELLLVEAFRNLRLDLVYGECYVSNIATGFWKHICEKYYGECFLIRKGGKVKGGMLYFDISWKDYALARG